MLDLIAFNNMKFGGYVRKFYPSQLTVEKSNKSNYLETHLDLSFITDNDNKLSGKVYDKCNDFNFHMVQLLLL